MVQARKSQIMESAGQPHHGHNIKRVRLLFGLPQKSVVALLGEGWTQKKLSRIENSAKVSRAAREELAWFFEVDIDLFDHFDEAAGRIALGCVTKLRRQLRSMGTIEDRLIMEEIVELLDEASKDIDRQTKNMKRLLSLLEQTKRKLENWPEADESDTSWTVKEPAFHLWRTA